jgi:hypothetical protein
MADIEFVDPPGGAKHHMKHPHYEIAEALKARPGTWARVLTDVAKDAKCWGGRYDW